MMTLRTLIAFALCSVVLLGFNVAAFDWCSVACDSGEHTMCIYEEKGGSACADWKRGLTAEEKKVILNYINELRQTVANGKETRGGGQPKAANMMELVWDDELETVAQRWADQCEEGSHDQCRKSSDGEEVGQNYAGSGGYGIALTAAKRLEMLKALTKSWYDEVKDMTPSYVKEFPQNPPKVVGHYTQLVWGDTSRVGCGVSAMQQGSAGQFNLRFICNFKASGNWVSEPVYQQGEPASQCSGSASTKYSGLCAPSTSTASSSGSQTASDADSTTSSSDTQTSSDTDSSTSESDQSTTSTSDKSNKKKPSSFSSFSQFYNFFKNSYLNKGSFS